MEISEREFYWNKLDKHYRDLCVDGIITEEELENKLDYFEGLLAEDMKKEWENI
jgi:hypothetical protein